MKLLGDNLKQQDEIGEVNVNAESALAGFNAALCN
jgi:hypothetical protein